MAKVANALKLNEIEYPESDGKPMAETDAHRDLMMQLIDSLRWRYRDEPGVYVSGNLLLYYVEGDPKKSKAPDVFVAKGVKKDRRRIYKLWEEGVAPCVVIELTSKSTRKEDQKEKLELYAQWGVREYFLYDPLNEYLRPPLQGFRLKRGRYEAMVSDEMGRIESQELGLLLDRDGARLRLWDLKTGKEILDGNERAEIAARQLAIAETKATIAEARVQFESARAAHSEAKIAAAEAEIAKLREQLERQTKRKK